MAKKIKLTNQDDDFTGGKQDEIINARGGDDNVSGGRGNDVINGGAGNDVLKGGADDDTLNGGADNDVLLGGAGDDNLNGGLGDNTLDGGLGDDTAVIEGNFADATITVDGDGYKIVTAGGTTTVKNVELFKFADGTKTADQLIVGGKTFALTAALDNITGTASDDLVAGSVDDNATFTNGDIVDGADGIDTLRVAITKAGITVLPTLKNVEKFEVTATAASAVNLVNSTGVTDFVVQSSSAVTTFDAVAAIAGVTVNNVLAGGGITLNYAAGTIAGTTDVQKIALNGAATAVVAGPITANGIETFDITATGANNAALAGDKLATVKVAGAGTLTTSFAATTLTSYDASASTGAQTVTFTGVSAVAVKGGTADDSFTFGATFTSGDTVDAGAGADTVSLDGGNYSVAGNDTLKGLIALKGVETLVFTGGTGATIDNSTLTNTEVKNFVFNTTVADTVTNAIAANVYAFGGANAGTTTIGMKAGETTLNLEARGTTTDDADFDSLVLTGANLTTVNISSQGLSTGTSGVADGDGAYNVGNMNSFGGVTAPVNTTFKVTGDAHTSATLGSVATFDASALTGDLWLWGSSGNDTLKGGKGANEIDGKAGVDTIDISASTAKVDLIDTNGNDDSANRDSITGFTAGAGGDHLGISTANTTAATLATAAPVVTTSASTVGAFLATTDILEFEVANIGTSLGDGSANSLDGTNLDALLDITTAVAGDEGYVVAYQNGNAYVFHVDSGGNTAVEAGEADLIAEIKGVAVGSLTAENFDLIT